MVFSRLRIAIADEFQARLQNIWGKHTLKYGFEYERNIYKINTIFDWSSCNVLGSMGLIPAGSAINQVNGFRITNNFGVCTLAWSAQIVCPAGCSDEHPDSAVDRRRS